MKEDLIQILSSAMDSKALTGATITTIAAVTAGTAEKATEATTALSLNDWSVIAVMFSAGATGIYMIFSIVQKVLEIRRTLRNSRSFPDTLNYTTEEVERDDS